MTVLYIPISTRRAANVIAAANIGWRGCHTHVTKRASRVVRGSTLAARLTRGEKADRAMLEATLQSRVLYRARKYGWKSAHAGRGTVGEYGLMTPMSKGWPDLVLAKAGHPLLFVELKRELQKPKPEQVEWLALLAQTGNNVAIWYPSDLRLGHIDTILKMEATIGLQDMREQGSAPRN